MDVADVHLRCLLGLPEAKRVNKSACLKRLDEWARVVQRWTKLGISQFFHKNPGEFGDSEAFFRAVALVTTLQRHCGVRSDQTQLGFGPNDPFKLESQFIHGIVQGHGGTCASLPVVYTAVGRRLGYPIKLVSTCRHLFCRWDDPIRGERFNIEGAGDGFDSLPDSEYRKWPVRLQPGEEKRFGYLISKKPYEELAGFIAERAYVHCDNRRYADAVATLVVACDLTPQYSIYPSVLRGTLETWHKYLLQRTPARFPELNIRFTNKQRWPSIPIQIEHQYATLVVHEDILTNPTFISRWWQPVRDGRMVDVPKSLEINNVVY